MDNKILTPEKFEELLTDITRLAGDSRELELSGESGYRRKLRQDMATAIAAYAALYASQRQDWISVEERLPDELQIVQAKGECDNENRRGIDACWICNGEWTSWWLKNITYWMPILPPPPDQQEAK